MFRIAQHQTEYLDAEADDRFAEDVRALIVEALPADAARISKEYEPLEAEEPAADRMDDFLYDVLHAADELEIEDDVDIAIFALITAAVDRLEEDRTELFEYIFLAWNRDGEPGRMRAAIIERYLTDHPNQDEAVTELRNLIKLAREAF